MTILGGENMISEMCYMLYKTDWKQNHGITTKKKIDSIKDYYKFLEENELNKNLYTYDDYLEEFGYDGELYVCYEEFLEAEYLDNEYICGLLKDEKLITMYYADIKE